MTEDAKVVWLPYLYANTYRWAEEPKKDVTSWIADRQPLLIEPSPANEPAFVLKTGDLEMIWRTDGEGLYREVCGRDGQPLGIPEIEALDEASGKEHLLFAHWGRNTSLVDYPLSANDRGNVAGVASSDVYWREPFEKGTAKIIGRPKTFKRWTADRQVEGAAAARAAAADALRHRDGFLVRKTTEPLIGVHRAQRSRTVVVQVWLEPDLEENAIATQAFTRRMHERSAQNVADNVRYSGVAFFRIDQAEEARRCAAEAAAEIEDGDVLDFLPEIEVTGAWPPRVDLSIPTLKALLSHIKMKTSRTELHGAAEEAEVMARRALRFAEQGDHSLVDHAMVAIMEEGPVEEGSVFEAFRQLNQRAEMIRDSKPDEDLGNVQTLGW